jgi:hypothetical protein
MRGVSLSVATACLSGSAPVTAAGHAFNDNLIDELVALQKD